MMTHSFLPLLSVYWVLTAGVFAAIAGGSGVSLLKDSPDIVSSLIIGTMIGIFFMSCCWTLTAAGMTYMGFKFIKSFSLISQL